MPPVGFEPTISAGERPLVYFITTFHILPCFISTSNCGRLWTNRPFSTSHPLFDANCSQERVFRMSGIYSEPVRSWYREQLCR